MDVCPSSTMKIMRICDIIEHILMILRIGFKSLKAFLPLTE